MSAGLPSRSGGPADSSILPAGPRPTFVRERASTLYAELEYVTAAMHDLVHEGWSSGAQRRALRAVEHANRVLRDRAGVTGDMASTSVSRLAVRPVFTNAVGGPATATPRGVR